jgi:hypothetical protein
MTDPLVIVETSVITGIVGVIAGYWLKLPTGSTDRLRLGAGDLRRRGRRSTIAPDWLGPSPTRDTWRPCADFQERSSKRCIRIW